MFFPLGRLSESQNRIRNFWGLFFGMSLVTPCRVLLVFVDFRIGNCCVFVEQTMNTRSQRGRDRLAGFLFVDVYELSCLMNQEMIQTCSSNMQNVVQHTEST